MEGSGSLDELLVSEMTRHGLTKEYLFKKAVIAVCRDEASELVNNAKRIKSEQIEVALRDAEGHGRVIDGKIKALMQERGEKIYLDAKDQITSATYEVFGTEEEGLAIEVYIDATEKGCTLKEACLSIDQRRITEPGTVIGPVRTDVLHHEIRKILNAASINIPTRPVNVEGTWIIAILKEINIPENTNESREELAVIEIEKQAERITNEILEILGIN